MKHKIFSAVFTCMLLCSCSGTKGGFIHSTDSTDIVYPVPYNLYTACERNVLNGAYIEENRPELDNIAAYEHFTGTDNDIYIISVKNDSEKTKNKILECIAQNKTPMLLVGQNTDTQSLYTTAKNIGNYNIPVYVAAACNSEDDVYFYKNTADIFRWYIPDVKTVWCCNTGNAQNAQKLFPGREYADIVAVNFTYSGEKEGFPNHISALEEFVASLKDMPVMINCAVSHYSAENNRYYTYDTVKQLKYVYQLPFFYENIIGINYVNYSPADKYKKGENYSIISDTKLTQAYKDACDTVKNINMLRTDSTVYMYDNNIYADKNTVDKQGLLTSGNSMTINGENFLSVNTQNMEIWEDKKIAVKK